MPIRQQRRLVDTMVPLCGICVGIALLATGIW